VFALRSGEEGARALMRRLAGVLTTGVTDPVNRGFAGAAWAESARWGYGTETIYAGLTYLDYLKTAVPNGVGLRTTNRPYMKLDELIPSTGIKGDWDHSMNYLLNQWLLNRRALFMQKWTAQSQSTSSFPNLYPFFQVAAPTLSQINAAEVLDERTVKFPSGTSISLTWPLGELVYLESSVVGGTEPLAVLDPMKAAAADVTVLTGTTLARTFSAPWHIKCRVRRTISGAVVWSPLVELRFVQ
jgi:hypothetical protein